MLTAVRATLGLDSFSFRGKAVLITGGSRGLGLVLARKLARERARIAIVARDEAELERAKTDLRRRGVEVPHQ
jgi:short-subunit dehydrogenase